MPPIFRLKLIPPIKFSEHHPQFPPVLSEHAVSRCHHPLPDVIMVTMMTLLVLTKMMFLAKVYGGLLSKRKQTHICSCCKCSPLDYPVSPLDGDPAPCIVCVKLFSRSESASILLCLTVLLFRYYKVRGEPWWTRISNSLAEVLVEFTFVDLVRPHCRTRLNH